jgi:hypothetical protein
MGTDAGSTPNLLADYLYLWETAVGKLAFKTAMTSVSLGRDSSRYLCQQDSGFMRWAIATGVLIRKLTLLILEGNRKP